MLGGTFFKPKWQNKNPHVRRQALLALDIASRAAQSVLAQMAHHDADPELRLLALKRIDSIEELAKFVNDASSELSTAACQSLAKCCQQALGAADLNTVTGLIDTCQDPQFIQLLMGQAADVALRQKALSKIDKPSLLAEIALNDTDQELRLTALKRINKVSTLQRIVKHSRRKDKQLFAQAQQQLDAMLVHELLPQQLQQQAQTLLAELNAVIKIGQEKQHWQASEAQVNALKQEWAAIQSRWQALALAQTLPQHDDLQRQFDFFTHQLQLSTEQQRAQQLAYEQDRERLERARSLLEHAQNIKSQCELALTDSAVGFEESREAWRVCQQQWDAQTAPDSPMGQSEQAKLQLRFGDAAQAIARMLQEGQQTQQWLRQSRQLLQEIDNLLQDEQLPSAADFRRTQKKWEKLVGKAIQPAPDVIDSTMQQVSHKLSLLQQRADQARQVRKTNSRLFADAVNELKVALQEGKAKHAINMLRRCEKLLPQSDISAHDPIQTEFQRVRSEARELQDWRNWSNSPVKENICAEVEALLQDLQDNAPGDVSVSYTKIAQQIRDYRQEWNSLSHTESHSDKSLQKRFEEICKAVEKICGEFFEQRDEQRKDNLSQRQKYCDKLQQYAEHVEAQNLADLDIKGLDKVIRTAQSEWRQLGVVETAEKDSINQRFKLIVSRLRNLQSAFRNDNHEAKKALVTRLEQLNQALDQDASGIHDAINTTKQLQAQWKQLGPATKEKELWDTFQALGNQVFARLDKQREQKKLTREKEQAELDAIIDTLDQIAVRSDAVDLAEMNQVLHASREQWRALEQRKQYKGHQKRFDRAFAQLEKRRNDLLAKNEIDKRREWINAFDKLGEIEASYAKGNGINGDVDVNALQTQYQVLASEAAAFILQMTSDSTGSHNNENELLAKRKRLCIVLEVLAGIPSPETDKEERMNYQVSVLAEKMKQGSTTDSWLQVTQNMRQWWSYGYTRQDSRAFNQRVISAAQALLEK